MVCSKIGIFRYSEEIGIVPYIDSEQLLKILHIHTAKSNCYNAINSQFM